VEIVLAPAHCASQVVELRARYCHRQLRTKQRRTEVVQSARFAQRSSIGVTRGSHFCGTSAQAILKNLGWRFCTMGKLVCGMNQSLDGYVDHKEFRLARVISSWLGARSSIRPIQRMSSRFTSCKTRSRSSNRAGLVTPNCPTWTPPATRRYAMHYLCLTNVPRGSGPINMHAFRRSIAMAPMMSEGEESLRFA
jgi:hypothetical protein